MKYVKVTGPDLCNGEGNRCTLWISGCTHACPNCHNEWLQNYEKGKDISFAKEEIYKLLSLPYIQGLTLSGGDPLDQSKESLLQLLEFLKQVKADFPEKDIWVYTGFTLEGLKEKKSDTINEILSIIDYIVDGLFVESLKGIDLAFRGSSNQNILHNEKGKYVVVDDKIFKN